MRKSIGNAQVWRGKATLKTRLVTLSPPKIMKHPVVGKRMTFINNRKTSVRVYWLNFQKKWTLYRTLAPNQSYTQHTYVGHVWKVVRASNGSVIWSGKASAGPAVQRVRFVQRIEQEINETEAEEQEVEDIEGDL